MLIPLLPGSWKPLPAGQAAGLASRLARMLANPRTHDALAPHHPVSGLRAMPLSFYPGWALIEGEATLSADTVATFDLLYGPGLMWLIDGDSQVLVDLNAGRLPADLDAYREGEAGDAGFLPSPLAPLDTGHTGPDYLRFFCASIWGDEGPFMPVESLSAPMLDGAASGDWMTAIRPLSVVHDGDELVGSGVIAYGRSLFEARLRLSGSSVLMEDDTLLAADVLPERHNLRPLRNLRPLAEAPSAPGH